MTPPRHGSGRSARSSSADQVSDSHSGASLTAASSDQPVRNLQALALVMAFPISPFESSFCTVTKFVWKASLAPFRSCWIFVASVTNDVASVVERLEADVFA